MDKDKRSNTTLIIIIGSLLIAFILIATNFWIASSAQKDNEKAARSVSLLYLDELAGRREQVVENNLSSRIRDLQTAVGLMEKEDLQDLERLQAYQARMKKLYNLEKFAFVDTEGLIYTSLGIQENISDYSFDHRSLAKPEISIFNLDSRDKKVVIAVPVDLDLQDKHFNICFMEIDMKEMLAGVSMESDPNSATFCNIYTRDGIALSDTILGGLAVEDNLLQAMRKADFDNDYDYDSFVEEFANNERGEVSFTYDGIKETLSFVAIRNTDWVLTYLVRESVISQQISGISQGIISRSLVQSLLSVLAMAIMFSMVYGEIRRSNRYQLEKEISQAELKAKEEELEQKTALQKQLEQQSQALSDALKAAEEASKAKTVFLSSMSHEIRTPMNAIIGLDNIALNDPETPEKTKEYLQKIGASADHLLYLINDILDMSRIESGKTVLKSEEFSFARMIEAINTMFDSQCQEKGLDYHCHLKGDIDDYYVGDNMKLRQVLINILGNAVKFTPEGGSIDFDVEKKGSFDGKSVIEFKIADTGIGMSEEFLPHIFDTFAQEDGSTTSKYGSSGLGMAISKNLVEMMNGNIRVESKKGEGTTFTVVVTLDDSKLQHDGDDAQVRPEDLKVLVVDDDKIAADYAKLVLDKAGIKHDVAYSGAQALEMARIACARRDPYDLLVIDWKMPQMDGIETARKIREIVKDDTAIIILTAYRWDDIQDEALNAGVDSFLPKPLFAQNILDEYRSALLKKNDRVLGKRADLCDRNILLAEDVQINAEIILMLLNGKDAKVDLACNGKEALDKFAASEPGHYDAILMDMRMPEMDGLEATRRIRALDREDARKIPIIALTANVFDEDVQRSLQAGLNAHLSKPVKPEELFTTLESLIGENDRR